MKSSEVIFKVGADGGDITLYGSRTSQGWQYRRSVMDQTPAILGGPWIEHDTLVVTSWLEALKLMDE